MSQQVEHLPSIPQLEQRLPPELVDQTLSGVKRAFSIMAWERGQRTGGIMPIPRIEQWHQDSPDISFTWDDTVIDKDGMSRSIQAIFVEDALETGNPYLSIQVNAWKDLVNDGKLIQRKWQNAEVVRARYPILNRRLLVEAMHEAHTTVFGWNELNLSRVSIPQQ